MKNIIYNMRGNMNNIEVLANYDPYKDKEYMSPAMRKYFQNILFDWKNRLLKDSNNIKNTIEAETEREPDLVDRGVIEEGREVQYKLADHDLEIIHEIDAALNRIEDGKYGFCEETGEELGIRRLIAWPIARLSIRAQEMREKNFVRVPEI
jgi:DnaK suppressor protein